MDPMQLRQGSSSTVGTVPTAADMGLSGSATDAPLARDNVIGDPETAAQTKLEPLDKTQIGEASVSAEGVEERTSRVLDDLSSQATQTVGAAGETLSQASATIGSALSSATETASNLASQAYNAVVGEQK